MPFSACVELTSGEHPELPCLETSQEPQHFGGCSKVKAVADKEPRLKFQVHFGFPGRVYLEKQSLLKDACSGMNDKATKPFGSWFKREAARHREASPCDLLWESDWPGVPQVHTHLPSPALHDSLMLQRQTRITPRNGSWLHGCGASQQPHVLRLQEPRVH